jgi:hypothetical protein
MAGDDTIAARLIGQGTHTAPFADVAPTQATSSPAFSSGATTPRPGIVILTDERPTRSRHHRRRKAMSSSNAEHLPTWGTAEHVPVAELARRQGVGPVTSVDELARPDLFESDEELADFLADLYAARHTGLA